ncbi:somatostatin receptor type 2-like [Tubulanus polymorphus]|uniref:somatostatin receptor type 2-like n=1 Tax=Tubulanus polymorphus TaxID=672921 RepID=UPI003DA684DD
MFEKDDYYEDINTWIYLVVTVNSPAGILVLANTTLLYSVYQTGKNRKAMLSTSEKAEGSANNKATQLVIIATFIYLFCELPTIISRIHTSFFKIKRTVAIKYLFEVLDNLTPFDSAINCVIYMIASKHFRKTATHILCSKSSS